MRAQSRESVLQSIKVSQYLLSAASYLESLRQLHLSFAVSAVHLLGLLPRLKQLRQLRLHYVALLPREGRWEDVLQCIAHSCRLDALYLRALEDLGSGQARLILRPETPIWKTAAAKALSYEEYEAAIVCFALRKSESLPPLLPDEFLQQKWSFAAHE